MLHGSVLYNRNSRSAFVKRRSWNQNAEMSEKGEM